MEGTGVTWPELFYQKSWNAKREWEDILAKAQKHEAVTYTCEDC